MSEDNINAGSAMLSQEIVRMGFHRFPQSEIALVNPALWPQIAPLLFAAGYPFRAMQSAHVPPGEVWFVDISQNLLGRIVGVAIAPGGVKARVTQDDSLDFIDNEADQAKVGKQEKRRKKDSLL
jgi:hypothetical protein